MKKWMSGLVILVLVLNIAGCASLQKKFTRKKKETRVPAAIYLQEGAYQKKYSNDYYYKTHFTLWKTWHEDLLNQLGGNRKKVARCAQEAMGQLNEINNYLIPEKQAQLKPQLDEMAKITRQLEGGDYADSQMGGIRVELEKIGRLVGNNYYYDKVKNEIAVDQVDLGEPAPSPSPSPSQQ